MTTNEITLMCEQTITRMNGAGLPVQRWRLLSPPFCRDGLKSNSGLSEGLSQGSIQAGLDNPLSTETPEPLWATCPLLHCIQGWVFSLDPG